MEKLLESGRAFRCSAPKPGSIEMIDKLGEMIEIYDSLGEIILSSNERERNMMVSALHGMKNIKREFLKQNWETLGRNTLLYGLEGAEKNS